MKLTYAILVAATVSTMMCPWSLHADLIHVATNGTSVSPYDTWAKAATNIHDAIALAGTNDTVLVSNGVFYVTNTITIGTNFTVLGVGYTDTIVERNPAGGSFPVFILDHPDALLAKVTATKGDKPGNNWTVSGIDIIAGTVSNCLITDCNSGVTIYMRGADSLMQYCVVSNNPSYAYPIRVNSGAVVEDTISIHNYAVERGGLLVMGGTARRCRILSNRANGGYGAAGVGLVSGTLRNCLIYGNSHNGNSHSGGVNMGGGVMENCTIVGNTNGVDATVGSGVNRTGGTIRNCVIYGNTGAGGKNYIGDVAAVWYSCAPELTYGAQGNLIVNPSFSDMSSGDLHLNGTSPCIDAGTNLAAIVDDVDRSSRPKDGDLDATATHDIGCYEMDAGGGPVEVAFTTYPDSGLLSVDCVLSATLSGTNRTITWWGWDFDNDGTYDLTGPGLQVVTNTYGGGSHSASVRVTNSIGETAVATNLNFLLVVGTDIYVSATGSHQFPYDSWAKGATNVHTAFSVAAGGCTIHIDDGTYATTNELVVTQDVTVQSRNGREATILERNDAFGMFRILVLDHANAKAGGLTLKNGNSPGGGNYSASGLRLLAGAVSNLTITGCNDGIPLFLEGSGTLVKNCIVSNNPAYAYPVRVASGAVLEDSTIAGNSAIETGGVRLYPGSTMRRCRVIDNTVHGQYGPAGVTVGGTCQNTLIARNSHNRTQSPGGVTVNGGLLESCTIVSNSNAVASAAGSGVGRTSGTIRNCIIYGNAGSGGTNYVGVVSAVSYSCAPELSSGVQGNITSDPLFLDAAGGDYGLADNSPCRNTGTNIAWMVGAFDLAGNDRIENNTVEMGAFEVMPPAGLVITIR